MPRKRNENKPPLNYSPPKETRCEFCGEVIVGDQFDSCHIDRSHSQCIKFLVAELRRVKEKVDKHDRDIANLNDLKHTHLD
jgi:hypothetical protein